MVNKNYIKILEEELVPALGCTEPIAIAYAAAKLREELPSLPDEVIIQSSGNMIKNVKSAVIPNTEGLKGMEVAFAAGLIVGDSSKALEILSDLNSDDINKINKFLNTSSVKVVHLDTPAKLHIIVSGTAKNDHASVELIHSHTNVVKIEKNGKAVFSKEFSTDENSSQSNRSCLNVKDIIEFANSVDINLIKKLLKTQEEYNTAIVQAGLNTESPFGLSKVILKQYQNTECFSIEAQAKAELSAAIEARLSGKSYAVITNSGSGTQGLCVSIPVLVFARELKLSEEKKLRALALSNLLAIHQKTSVGRLSAFCGTAGATTAAVSAITYLKGGTYEQISATLTNSLAAVAGIICDGAKVSCSAKAVLSLNAAFLAHHLAMSGDIVEAGDGIVKDDVEKTISSVGILASKGMQETDKVILDIMLDQGVAAK
ncbi:MAG: hypothetical protein CR988_04060 [Treponema sp.]|nr:MAG: hypothetical protein CR988_04060 [Treponema sp.]